MTAYALTPVTLAGALEACPELRADEHPAVVYLARLCPSSRRTMLQALARVVALMTGTPEAPPPGTSAPAWQERLAYAFRWDALRRQHAAAIRARVLERYGLAAGRTTLAAVRGVLKEAWRLGLMTAEDYHRAADIEPVRGKAHPRGRALSRGELLALVDTCKRDSAPAGARDAALVAVLYAAGLRRAEAVALNLEDFDPEAGVLVVRCGKGRKARTVPLRNGARRALMAWIEARGPEAGPLFYAGRRGGKLEARRLTPDAVLKLLARRATAAGIVARFSPHDLRRTFAGDMLDAGADISTVRELMGHASVTTTASYDRRGEQAKAKAAELLHFPY